MTASRKTEDAEIFDPEEEHIGPVSGQEARGIWRQLDTQRNGMWRVLKRMDAFEDMARDVRALKIMVGLPCFLSTVVLLRVVWLLLPKSMEPLATLAAVLP